MAAASTAAVSADGRGARVLLVDDSDIVRDVSRALLEAAGTIVDEAHDGAMAVRMAGKPGAGYGLIFMDVQMPVLDGLAAARQIRAALGKDTPPIVALTAQASEQDWHVCRDAGMLDRVSKPVDPQQLMAALHRWLPPSSGACGPARVAMDNVPAGNVSFQNSQGLPEVPGFDLATGLQCVTGNTDLLRSMLRRFGATAGGLVAGLRLSIAAENYVEARRVAHNLKGTAATLGGRSIASAAERLEHVLQQRCESGDADYLTPLAALDLALAEALPALGALYAAPDAALPPLEMPHTLTPGEAAEVEALRQLLAGNCYAARKVFISLNGRLGADDAHWQAAAAAMDALDFQQALAQIDARYPAIARPTAQSPL